MLLDFFRFHCRRIFWLPVSNIPIGAFHFSQYKYSYYI
nr:MAG TPA: hypothetical protein [Caudoviricetes sp.]